MRATALKAFVSGLVALLMLALPAHDACAQAKLTLTDTRAVRALTDAVMAKVGTGDMEAGLRLLQPYIVIPTAEFEAVIGQAKLQVPAMAQRFGKSVGSEFLREEKAGERLLRITQLNLFEQHATRWSFYFYRTPKGWVLNTFQFNDDIKSFF
jgi:hypothetical protein